MSDIMGKIKSGTNQSNDPNFEMHKDLIGQVCKLTSKLKFDGSLNVKYNIEDWLIKYQRKLTETMVYCYTSEVGKIPCSVIFREVFTEAGLCYNVNSLPPRLLYRDGV